MKKYRERIKNFIAVFIILVMIVAFILIFRDTLTEVFRTAWDMTVGELETPCTPDDRFLYLQKHPGEIKLAFIGNWAQGNDCGMPRQKCLKQAIQEINQTGGINGRKIIPVWMDSMLSSDHLLSYIENVAYDPSFFAVIGPGTSGQLLSVKPLILNYRLLTIAPGITDPEAYSKEEPPYIFLPNPSDDQNVQEIIRWIKKKNRDNFILISENMTFASGYAKYLERMFYENNITLCTRSFFNPEYNIRFFLDELKNYFLYFKAQNAIILNYSKTNETSEQLIKWMLSHASGDIFSIKPFIGPYTSEEQKRMFTLVYWDRKDGRNVCLSKQAHIQDALYDANSLIAYRSMFILADACKKAKSLHQQDVLDALRNELLDTPYRPFRFAPNHFEEKPMIRVISVYDLMQVMKNIPADSGHTENGVPPKTDERK